MTVKETIRDYLISSGEPVTNKQIIEATGATKGTISAAMSEFREQGLVEVIDDGHPSGRKLYCWTGSGSGTTSSCCGRCDSKISAYETQPEEAGAYHGMTERNPDDAPEIESYETNAICDDCVNYNHCAKGIELEQCLVEMEREKRHRVDMPEYVVTYHDSMIAALNAAETALNAYRKRRKVDAIESGLLAAIEALEETIKGDHHAP